MERIGNSDTQPQPSSAQNAGRPQQQPQGPPNGQPTPLAGQQQLAQAEQHLLVDYLRLLSAAAQQAAAQQRPGAAQQPAVQNPVTFNPPSTSASSAGSTTAQNGVQQLQQDLGAAWAALANLIGEALPASQPQSYSTSDQTFQYQTQVTRNGSGSNSVSVTISVTNVSNSKSTPGTNSTVVLITQSQLASFEGSVASQLQSQGAKLGLGLSNAQFTAVATTNAVIPVAAVNNAIQLIQQTAALSGLIDNITTAVDAGFSLPAAAGFQFLEQFVDPSAQFTQAWDKMANEFNQSMQLAANENNNTLYTANSALNPAFILQPSPVQGFQLTITNLTTSGSQGQSMTINPALRYNGYGATMISNEAYGLTGSQNLATNSATPSLTINF